MTNGYVEAPPGEIARIVKVLMGKGGAGKPTFPKIDLSSVPIDGPDGTIEFASVHTNLGGSAGIHVTHYGLRGNGSVSAATARPDRILDFVETLFQGDRPTRFELDDGTGPDGGKIVLSNGKRTASVSACAVGDVPKTARPDVYGEAVDSLRISTDPKKRPANGSDWPLWAEKGYTVCHIDPAELTALLEAGRILVAHSYRNTLVAFTFGDGKVSAVVTDPKDASAEVVRFDPLANSTVVGTPKETFSISYAGVEAQLSSLSLLKAKEIVLVHHPDEARINFCAAEKDEQGHVVFAVTETVPFWEDPRTRKKN